MGPQVQAIAAWALAGLLLLAAAPARADDNPLAPAEAGKLACFKPNDEAKTCWVIASFKKLEDGRYETSIKSRFSNTSDYESRSKTVMALKGGKLCNIFDKAQYEEARFFHLGDEVIKQDLDVLRAQVIDQFKNEFGKEYCTAFGTPDGAGLIKLENTVDGQLQPPGTTLETLSWVAPDAGYKLRPSSR